MSILDSRAEFCDNTTLATATGTAVKGNVVDLVGASGTDLPGNSDGLYFVLKTGATAFTSADGAAGTVNFQLVSNDNVDLTSGTPTIHYQTGTIATGTVAAANLAANTLLAAVELPRGTYKRYLGVRAVVATKDIGVGTLDAYLTMDPPTRDILPDGIGADVS